MVTQLAVASGEPDRSQKAIGRRYSRSGLAPHGSPSGLALGLDALRVRGSVG
ncbi:MAG: hypothetical protein JNM40_02735 [Myxococcales bacterium]|nr:hypothetical protein [Myxococcales bacterium]